MSFRPSTLLCLVGLAACSHQPEPETAQDATYVDQRPVATNDADMTPASLENANPGARPAAQQTADARAPLVADTKGTSPNPAPASEPVDPNRADPPRAADPAPAGTPPDNTKVNKRDANASALTPLDQKENESDLKITQQIRQAVMADGTLSFTAKNVKIITQNGKVTLRGPVNNAQERAAVEAAARKVAGTAQVDNQLEVKK